MANNGSFSKSLWDGHYVLRVDWTAKPDTPSNTSTITAKVYFVNDWALQIGSRTGNSVVINGVSYSFNSPAISSTGSHLLATITSNAIAHNSYGSKTVAMSCNFKMNATLSSGSYGTQTVNTLTASASLTLDRITRKSTLSAGNGTLGTAQTLTINKAADGFTHTVTYKCGTATGTIATKSTAKTLSFTPPLSLVSQNTAGTSVSVTFTITTYSGTSNLGSNTKTITCAIPSSVKPSCSLTVTDADGYDAKYGGSVKGVSKFKVKVTPITAYSSPISSYAVTANGANYNSGDFTTSILNSCGTLSVTAKVTDKRSRTSDLATVSKSVLDYSPPRITKLEISRCDANGNDDSKGDYVKAAFGAEISPLNNKNSANYTLRYKKSSETDYTSVSLTNYQNRYSFSDGKYIISAADGKSYDFILTAADDFNDATKGDSGGAMGFAFSWFSKFRGFALGKIAEFEGVFDTAWKIFPRGGFVNPLLPKGTDFDSLKTPNVFAGCNANDAGYSNCPIDSSTFTFEVMSAGDAGQILQRLTACVENLSITYERFYYDNLWSEWQISKKLPESGEANGGRYIKFADGTLICTKKMTYNTDVTTQEGSLYYGARQSLGEFAHEFADEPAVSVHLIGGSSGFMDALKDRSGGKSIGTINVYRPTPLAGAAYILHIIAVGRWR